MPVKYTFYCFATATVETPINLGLNFDGSAGLLELNKEYTCLVDMLGYNFNNELFATISLSFNIRNIDGIIQFTSNIFVLQNNVSVSGSTLTLEAVKIDRCILIVITSPIQSNWGSRIKLAL